MNSFNNIASEVKICMGQIKTVSGDLEGNTQRILKAIEQSVKEKADILVLPELAITGYNCGMLFNQQKFIDYNLKFLHKIIAPSVPENLVVIVGFVDCIGKKFDGNPNIQNSLAVIQDGYVVGKYAKILLANGGHHDDTHYFTPGEHAVVTKVRIRGLDINIGTVICEDFWSSDHERNIVKESIQNGAEVIIAINQSFFYYQKQIIRQNICRKHAQENNVYFISCNNVGVGDISKNFMVYDGGSMIINTQGIPIYESKRFLEQVETVQMNQWKGQYTYSCDKFEDIFNALVYAQKEIFKDLGFKKAIVAVSGGLDSSVTLPIVVEAMKAENVYAISMPSKYNSDLTKSNAQKLCDALGVKLYWIPLNAIQDNFIDIFKYTFKEEPSLLNISTFDAVSRTVAGIASSQHLKAGLVSTSNHTETVLNWFSWHDISTAAVYAPLADMTKVEVFQMAKYINEKFSKEIIPVNLFDGTTEPGPELADATHAKWNYFVVSGICSMLIRGRMDVQQIIQAYLNRELMTDFFPVDPKGKTIYDLIPTVEEFEKWAWICFERQKQSVYKAAQAAPPLIISPLSRGFSNRETIINYYTGQYTLNQKELV